MIDTPWLDSQLRRVGKLERYGFLPSRESPVTWLFRHIVARYVERYRPDAIVSVAAAHKIAGLGSGVPVVHVADAMFSTISRYYPKYHRFSERSRRMGDRVQLDLIRRVDAVALASDWAAESARHDYPWAAERIHVVPFGANLRDPLGGEGLIHRTGQLKFLFVGYDWERKGGPQVIRVFDLVRAQQPDAELHIVGCAPHEAKNRPGVHLHGVLRKDVPDDFAKLRELMATSSFLFMPSQEEAFGIIYCEACAYGLPPIARRTGGVTTIIRDGENGMTFAPEASPNDYVERILRCWTDRSAYRRLEAGARHAYETRLNWRTWADQIERMLVQLVGASRAG